ncbi:hypothetical protein HMPREF9554_02736 [Treponema phagedenis F0421]|nr:hypothetical protein HMPREF9554_02736 [Treponema phagedenis F0421]
MLCIYPNRKAAVLIIQNYNVALETELTGGLFFLPQEDIFKV